MVQFLFRGGYTMIPILLCSVLALAVIIERGISLRSGRVLPAALKNKLNKLARGEEISLRTRQAETSPLGKILALCYRNRNLSREENQESIRLAEKQVASRLERGLVLLEIVAVVSPLLGLLGTVIGMVQVFNVISQLGVGHARALSGGISQALITTIAGLVIAIPALIAHSIYARKVDTLLLGIEEAVTTLLHKLYADNHPH